MAVILSDEFVGSGSVIGRTPDVGYGGVVWAAASANMALVSGALENISSPFDSMAWYGIDGANYGNPAACVCSFSMTTPSTIPPGSFVLLVITGGIFSLRLDIAPGTLFAIANDGTYVPPVTAAVSTSVNTTYSGTVTFGGTNVIVNFLGKTLEVVDTTIPPAGLSKFLVALPAGGRLNSFSLNTIDTSFWTQLNGCVEV